MKNIIRKMISSVLISSSIMSLSANAVTLSDWLNVHPDFKDAGIVSYEMEKIPTILPAIIKSISNEKTIYIESTKEIKGITLYVAAYNNGILVKIHKQPVSVSEGENTITTGINWDSVQKDEIKIFLLDDNLSPYAHSTVKSDFTIRYGSDSGDFIIAKAGESFIIPCPEITGLEFIGYFTDDNVQITDNNGKSLPQYKLNNDIEVHPEFNQVNSLADTEKGLYLGNPLEGYYYEGNAPISNNGGVYCIYYARNPWDLTLWNDKLYIGGGNYDANNGREPIFYYDINTETFGTAPIKKMIYNSNQGKWEETECMTVKDSSGKVISVADQFSLSDMRIIDGKLMMPGTDTASYRPYGDYFVLEKDEYGGDIWVEYFNSIDYGDHIFDITDIQVGSTKKLLFGLGTASYLKTPAIIYNNDGTRTNTPVVLYKNGEDVTTVEGNNNYRIYDFFKTDEGIYAFASVRIVNSSGNNVWTYAIYKYTSEYNDETKEYSARFDFVRDWKNTSSNHYYFTDTGRENRSVRLWDNFFKKVTYNGYTYFTSGYLKATKDFNTITTITTPDNAIISDLMVKDNELYALGFIRNQTTENYKNYIWKIDTSNKFTKIREFDTESGYALSFEKDKYFFYVGIGGPSNYKNLGDIIKLSINPIK